MRKILMATLAVTLASCASTSNTTTADVRTAIDRMNSRMVTAMNTARFDDLRDVYTPDAVVLAANAPPFAGYPAIRQFWGQVGTMKMRDVSLTTDQLEVHGDVAIETGSYKMTLTPPGAPGPVNDQGKYMVVWKRQSDGGWRIYRDMFSSNLPMH